MSYQECLVLFDIARVGSSLCGDAIIVAGESFTRRRGETNQTKVSAACIGKFLRHNSLRGHMRQVQRPPSTVQTIHCLQSPFSRYHKRAGRSD